jgi:alpha-beta hydrolase superfamily lysophospholipase
MQRQQFEFSGVGDVRIQGQAWLTDEPPVAVVILVHGAAEHCGRYEHVAARLNADHFAAYAIDHRGHGRSGGRRGSIGRFAWLIADLRTLVERARLAHPDLPIFMVGHSMGGTIALGYALAHPRAITALALSAPALSMGDVVPAWQVRIVRLLSVIAPNLGLLTLPATAVSRDPAVVKAYDEDPLVFRGAVPARSLAELAGAMSNFSQRAAELRMPVLIQHGTGDTLVPLAGNRLIYEQLGSADKTLLIYEGLYHEIFNEPEQQRVLDDLLAWLGQHAANGRAPTL